MERQPSCGPLAHHSLSDGNPLIGSRNGSSVFEKHALRISHCRRSSKGFPVPENSHQRGLTPSLWSGSWKSAIVPPKACVGRLAPKLFSTTWPETLL